jgi:hypothetical protein
MGAKRPAVSLYERVENAGLVYLCEKLCEVEEGHGRRVLKEAQDPLLRELKRARDQVGRSRQIVGENQVVAHACRDQTGLAELCSGGEPQEA